MTSGFTAAANIIAPDPLVGGSWPVLIGRLLFSRSRSDAPSRASYSSPGSPCCCSMTGSSLSRLQITGTPYRDTFVGTLKVSWWLWAAWFLVDVVRAAVILERRTRGGRLIRISMLLSPLSPTFFDLPIHPRSLATSGAIAIVLGLALQSTLNDVFPVWCSVSAVHTCREIGSNSTAQPRARLSN